MTWIINPYRYVTGGGPPPSLAIAATNNYKSAAGATSHAVNLPTGISSGDLLLIFFAFNSTATVTDPSGWTALITKVNSDTYYLYAKIATGSEGSTETIGLSANRLAVAKSYRITGNRNGLTSSEIAISAPVDGVTSIPNPPNLTPSWGSAENLWIAITFSQSNLYTFSSYPTNYTLGQDNLQSSGLTNGTALSIASRLLTASSEDPGVFTTVTASTRSTYTIAIRPQ